MIPLQAIEDTREKIKDLVKQTPLIRSEFLGVFCGGEVYLKLENQQITNSFKIRGALNRMLNLTSEEIERGVITASSGNHAQAVAIGAEKLNISAKIVVPTNTSKVKLKKIRKHEVELVLFGDDYDEAEEYAKELAKKERRTWISPYNDKWVVAGQGTIGLEILEELPTVDEVLVPVGGGGLIAGIAIALKSNKPDVVVLGVQSEACPVMHASLKAGKIVDVEMEESIADGMYGGIEKGSITFDITKQYVNEVLLVKEETIKKALALLWHKAKLRTEASGAIAIAPLLENKERFSDKTIVCVISGGNIEEALFQAILSEIALDEL